MPSWRTTRVAVRRVHRRRSVFLAANGLTRARSDQPGAVQAERVPLPVCQSGLQCSPTARKAVVPFVVGSTAVIVVALRWPGPVWVFPVPDTPLRITNPFVAAGRSGTPATFPSVHGESLDQPRDTALRITPSSARYTCDGPRATQVLGPVGCRVPPLELAAGSRSCLQAPRSGCQLPLGRRQRARLPALTELA